LAGVPRITGSEAFGELIAHPAENPPSVGRRVVVFQQRCEIKRRTEFPGKYANLVGRIE
jgi:hypothetical protein